MLFCQRGERVGRFLRGELGRELGLVLWVGFGLGVRLNVSV